MKDIEYLKRLEKDLSEILEIQKTKILTDEILSNTILANVREICLSEILTYKNQNEPLSKYLESFTNRVLSSITDSTSRYNTEKIKIDSRIEMLEALISKAQKEKEEELNKIVQERDGELEREKRDIRKTGERPKTAKEKRSHSGPEDTQEEEL